MCKYLRYFPCTPIYYTYLDIQEFFCKYWWTIIDWVSGTIECSTKHLNAHGHTEYITGELTSGGQVINFRGTLENLHA